MQHAHVPRAQTVTPEGSVKHFWNVPQDTHHDNKIRSPDTEDVPANQGAALLDLVPPEHTMPEGDNESTDKY